jgi:membrane associated rhomboid family serine protease
MLILPLHRPLTRANFPLATAILILINVLVFFGFQLADDAALSAAQEHYLKSGLAQYEGPAYETYLERTGRKEELAELRAIPEEVRAYVMFQETLTDTGFARELHAGTLLQDAKKRADWQPLRERQETLRGKVFTLRHVLRSSEIDPWRMLSSAFLHGGLMHLLGNMIFLGALGLLVEGSLGPLRFTGLYLLGALGSSAVSLAWRWGEAGGGLGASGAIAALMGGFCVIWGRQPVRFFYWFGVLFDYVRAPAIWLLPIWLGWELYNLFAHDELAIGFDAHAGGLVTGALLGVALVTTRQVRRDFIEDAGSEASSDERWEQAQLHLGKLQLAEADALLVSLQQEQPHRLDVALARYRVAQNGPQRALRAARANDVLRIPAADAAAARLQSELLAQAPELQPDTAQCAVLAQRWLQLGQADAVERLLGATAASADAAAESLLAQRWFELGLLRRERQETEAARRVLQGLVARFPTLPQAQKARFLLENA